MLGFMVLLAPLFAAAQSGSTPYFDSDSSTLFIPRVDAGDFGSLRVSLRLLDEQALTFTVLEATAADAGIPTLAAYDATAQVLSVPLARVGFESFALSFQLQPGDVFQLMLARQVTAQFAGLAVGDSILDWNRDEGVSIPDIVSAELGIEIRNGAVGGATILGDDDIPSQYEPDAWGLLIVDGGGNDIGDACNDILDEIVSPDLSSGKLVDLIDRARGDGTELVVLLGYYLIPPAAGEFACPKDFEALDARYADFAASRAGVIFVDPDDAFNSQDMRYYDEDLVHPSFLGSAAVGRLIADRVRDAL